MASKVNAVILSADGKFLRSAFFPARGKANPRWAAEYPDATLYTLGEADAAAVKLRDAGFSVSIVRDYGMANEETFAV